MKIKELAWIVYQDGKGFWATKERRIVTLKTKPATKATPIRPHATFKGKSRSEPDYADLTHVWSDELKALEHACRLQRADIYKYDRLSSAGAKHLDKLTHAYQDILFPLAAE